MVVSSSSAPAPENGNKTTTIAKTTETTTKTSMEITVVRTEQHNAKIVIYSDFFSICSNRSPRTAIFFLKRTVPWDS